MNKYKTNIDSIGTEISDTEYDQKGGNFLARIFGVDNTDNNSTLISSETVKDTETNNTNSVNLTPLIIKAIDDGNYQVADYLITQRFSPDLEYVNKKKQNLINALINARDKMKNADKALVQLIPYDSNALNKADNNGVTPFFNAVKNGYNDLANYMENFGAKRISPSNDYDIVTDKEPNDVSTSSVVINLDTITEQKPKSSIFAKQNENNEQKNDAITDIVRAFKTKSDNSTELVGTIALGPTEQPDAYNVFDTNAINEKQKDIKASLETLKNLINNRSSPKQSNSIFQNPLNGIHNISNTDELVDNLAERLVGEQNGGARKNRADLRKISRSVNKQKNNFHETAVEKIYELLPKDKKDMLTAKAVKSLIYSEIKEKNKELTGLDRASELLKAVTKDKIKEVLKNDDEIKKIIEYLSNKPSRNNTSDSASAN